MIYYNLILFHCQVTMFVWQITGWHKKAFVKSPQAFTVNRREDIRLTKLCMKRLPHSISRESSSWP